MLILSDLAIHALPVTPSDTVLLSHISEGLWIGSVGDVTVTMMGREKVTFTAVPTGTWLPIRVTQIWSTGTTASNIINLWGV